MVVEYLKLLRDSYNEEVMGQIHDDLNKVNFSSGKSTALDDVLEIPEFIEKYKIREKSVNESAVTKES